MPRATRRHHPAGQRPDEDPSLAVRNNGGARAVHRAGPGRTARGAAGALLRRPRGPRRRDAVPRERHPRPRHPARAAARTVAEHYHHFGGVSPINEQNKALIAAVEKELAAAGIDLPVYWGNRNWAPYVEDTWQQMADDGIEHVYVFADVGLRLVLRLPAVPRGHRPGPRRATGGGPTAEKLPHYFDAPGFVQANADALAAALAVAARGRPRHRPAGRDGAQHPGLDGRRRRAATAAPTRPSCWRRRERVVAEVAPGRPFDLVWQSRSGPPSVPWLEPDVNDHLRALAAAGETAVVALPGRLHQRPPRGDLGPRQRGEGDRRRSSGWPSPAPRRPAPTRRSSRTVRELLEERRAGGLPAAGHQLPGRLLFRRPATRAAASPLS